MSIALTSNGVTYGDTTSDSSNAVNKGALITIATYTATGTYTVPPNCSKLHILCVGGGGGAAGYCESGGAGGYAEGVYTVTPNTTYTVTIGAGGGAVGYYAAAGNGGTSSFGALISATGGYGANQNYGHAGGHSGLGSGGQVNVYQGSGSGHANSGSHAQDARGGSTLFGGPGGKTRSNDGANYNPAPGSGASGGITEVGSSGSVGKSGLIIVYAYK